MVMTIFKQMWNFISNGMHIFRLSVKGQYAQESEEIKKIKKEVLDNSSNRHTDKENLIEDRKKIASDMHKAINKTILTHG